ncbi:MAG TPA: TolC family protein, partial [Candidatus Binataceae bacterium]|nr:TolC family protein [Candidatus Binataceae bacterium]
MLRRSGIVLAGGMTARLMPAVLAIVTVVLPTAHAETVASALAEAYQNNPQLGAQRAVVRETDEQVPQALSGYRPHVSVQATLGVQSVSTTSKLVPAPPGIPPPQFTDSGENMPYSAGFTATQNLYNGFQTANRTRAAETQVSAARA